MLNNLCYHELLGFYLCQYSTNLDFINTNRRIKRIRNKKNE